MSLWNKAMTDILFSDRVQLRIGEDGKTAYVWFPYHEKAIADIKRTFNSREALGDAYGLDPGAEWDAVLKCWKVHIGWLDCEDWLDKLIELLNRWFPEAGREN
jgi:hypothetical protein